MRRKRIPRVGSDLPSTAFTAVYTGMRSDAPGSSDRIEGRVVRRSKELSILIKSHTSTLAKFAVKAIRYASAKSLYALIVLTANVDQLLEHINKPRATQCIARSN